MNTLSDPRMTTRATPGSASTSFLDVATSIGDRLCRDAIWDGPRCNWMGFGMVPVGDGMSPAYHALPPSFYSGVAGVAFFLLRLWQRSQDPEHGRTLRGAVEQLRRSAVGQGGATPASFYGGFGGVGYVLALTGAALEHRELTREGLTLVARTKDSEFSGLDDVVTGRAGLIAPMIDLGRQFDREDLLATALNHASHLCASARFSERGASWATPHGGQLDLLGYSHGVAGIVTALAEARVVEDRSGFAEAIALGLRYERTWFDPAVDNWPDHRVDTSDPSAPALAGHSVAWCHGAPGIGLSRLRLATIFGADAGLIAEIDAAVLSTSRVLLDQGGRPSTDFSLCHGTAGLVEFLFEVGRRCERADVGLIAEAAARQGRVQFHDSRSPWPCGVNGAGTSPSLLLGTAGIGYLYLRLADPSVPSVLVITPSSS